MINVSTIKLTTAVFDGNDVYEYLSRDAIIVFVVEFEWNSPCCSQVFYLLTLNGLLSFGLDYKKLEVQPGPRANLKTGVSRKQSTPNFPCAWYVCARVHTRKWEMFVCRKIWRALFSWNTRFDISPFALLPTKYHY